MSMFISGSATSTGSLQLLKINAEDAAHNTYLPGIRIERAVTSDTTPIGGFSTGIDFHHSKNAHATTQYVGSIRLDQESGALTGTGTDMQFHVADGRGDTLHKILTLSGGDGKNRVFISGSATTPHNLIIDSGITQGVQSASIQIRYANDNDYGLEMGWGPTIVGRSGNNSGRNFTIAMRNKGTPDTNDSSIHFETGGRNGAPGSVRMVVHDNGNVGIGTTTPGTNLLQVFRADGTNSGDYTAQIYNADTTSDQGHGLLIRAGNDSSDIPLIVRSRDNNTTYLKVNGAGKVGIGTASPDSPLEIASGNDPLLNLNKTGGGNAAIHFEHAGTDKGYIYVDTSMNIHFGNTSVNPTFEITSAGTGIFAENVQLSNGQQIQWGDANNAIFGHAGSDYVQIKTDGTDRVKITSAGLEVFTGNVSGSATSTGSFGTIRTKNHPSSGNPALFIKSSGGVDSSVGIGTNSPYDGFYPVLHINGAQPALLFTDSDDASNDFLQIIHNANQTNIFSKDDSSAVINFGGATNSGGTSLQKRITLNLHTGTVSGSATSTGSFAQVKAHEIVIQSGDILSWGTEDSGYHIQGSTVSNRLSFFTNGSERMRIVQGGNVGIGITNPTGSLHVMAAQPEVIIQNSTQDGSSTKLRLTEAPVDGKAGGYLHYDGSANIFHIGTHISGTDTAKITILRDGTKVGIGRTPVNYPLEVAGHVELKSSGRVFLETGGAIADNGTNSWLMIPKDGASLQHFYTNGSSAMVIDGSQNVGIGTISPAAKLHISASASPLTQDILIVDNTVKNRALHLGLTDGNSSIQAKLTNGTTNKLLIQPSGSATEFGGNVSGSATSTGSFGHGFIDGNLSVGTTATNTTVTLNSTSNTQIQFHDNATGTSAGRGVRVGWNGTVGQFYVFENAGFRIATNNTERITVAAGGLVGINQTSPGAVLEVKGQTGVSNTALITHGLVQFKTTHNDSSELRHQFTMGGASDAGSYQIFQGDASTIGVNLNAGSVSYFNGGNVGIGDATPDAPLDIEGSANPLMILNVTSGNSALHFQNAGTTTGHIYVDGSKNMYLSTVTTNPAIFLKANGNVGIGTTSPNTRLHIEGSTPILQLRETSGTSEVGISFNHSTGGSQYNWFAGTQDGDVRKFQIGATVTNGHSTDTAQASNSLLTINQNGGLVGIGTSSPTAKLHVEAGSDNATGGIRLTNDDTGQGSTDGTAIFIEQNTKDFFIRNYEDAGIRLRTDDTDALYISNGQNVGIGTTSPSNKLQIQGGGITVSGSNDTSAIQAMLIKTSAASSQGLIGVEGSGTGFIGGTIARAMIVASTATGTALQLGTAGSVRATIASNGKVGIGTAIPSNLLTLRPGGGEGMTISGSNTRLEFKDDNGYQRIEAGASTNNSFASFIQMKSIDNVLTTQITAGGADSFISSGSFGIGTTSPTDIHHVHNPGATTGWTHYTNTSTGTASTDGTHIGTNGIHAYLWNRENADIYFGTNNTTSMLVKNDGKVGIGNTAPPNLLSVGGSIHMTTAGLVGIGLAAPEVDLHISNASPAIRFTDENLSNLKHQIIGGGDAGLEYSADFNNVANGYHRWDISNSEKMRLVESGNLGIGTTSPSVRLSVNSATSDAVALFESTDTYAGIQIKDSSDDLYIASSGGNAYFGFTFGSNTTNNLRLSNTGDLTLANGGDISGSATSTGSFGHLKANSIDFEDGSGNTYMKYNSADIAGDGTPGLTIGDVDGVNTNAKLQFDVTNAEARFQSMNVIAPILDASTSVNGPNGSESVPAFQFNTSNDGFFHDGGIKVITNNSVDFLFADNGDFHADADVISFSTSVSDKKLKDNIKTIKFGLDKIKNLRGVEFTWNDGGREGQRDIGLIAQEIEKVIPEVVREKEMPLMDKSGKKYKTIDYDKITAVLIEAVKEQQEQIDELKKQVKELRDGSSK